MLFLLLMRYVGSLQPYLRPCPQRMNRHTDGIIVFFKGLRWTVLSDETHRGRSLGRYFVDPLMLYPLIIPRRIQLPSRG